jgi:uncharacterized protein (DUF58 family)
LDYRALAAIAVGLATLLAFATVWMAHRLRISVIRSISPDRLRVGEVAQGRLTVHNRSSLFSFPFHAVDRVGVDAIEVTVGTIHGGGRRVVDYSVLATRRGRVHVGPLTVERRDPFGFFLRQRSIAALGRLWVHPRVHLALPLQPGVVLDYEGRFTLSTQPGTATFASIRDYVPGDDPRRIHWRSSARTGQLMVREHIDTVEPAMAVVLDNAARLDPAIFEHAVEVAASIVHAMEQHGRPIDLHIVTRSDPDGEVCLLDRLALVALAPPAPTAVLGTIARIRAGGALVVITGGEPALVTRLAEQRRRFSPTVIISLLAGEALLLAGSRGRAGLVVLRARTAGEAIDQWNRLATGNLG